MRVSPLVCWCFFPGVFLSSRAAGACPVTTDLIMQANLENNNNRGGYWGIPHTPISISTACPCNYRVFAIRTSDSAPQSRTQLLVGHFVLVQRSSSCYYELVSRTLSTRRSQRNRGITRASEVTPSLCKRRTY